MVNLATCSCGEELNQSIAFKDDDVKSCPNCSVDAGRHVFYMYDDLCTMISATGSLAVTKCCSRGVRRAAPAAGWNTSLRS